MAIAKVSVWPIVSNILLIICVVYIFTNYIGTRSLKKEQQEIIKNEFVLIKQINDNLFKIDSLNREIKKRDSILSIVPAKQYTFEQFKKRYEEINKPVINLSIDDHIRFFAKETSN